MSKKKPKRSLRAPHVHSRGRKGRKRLSGARYKSGGLKPPGPSAELLAHRQSIAADPNMAENPLDAAFSNGWLTAAEHRSGRAYAVLYQRAKMGGPSGRTTAAVAETSGESVIDLAGLGLRDMNDFELNALWDTVFSESAGASAEVAGHRAGAAANPIAADATLCAQASPWRHAVAPRDLSP